MMRRSPHRKRTRPNHERWLVSYADFITLLFAFFVVMFASSQADQKKAARLANAIEQAFQELGLGQARSGARPLPPTEIKPAAETPVLQQQEIGHVSREMSAAEIRALNDELERALALEIRRHEIALRSSPDGLIVSLQELGFFDSGSATLRPSSLETFGRIAGVLQERRCKVRIEGHTDPVPIHTAQFDSNWELSTARASGLVKLLIQKYGYDPANLAAGGYAEYHPVASNDSAEGRRINRRVDIVIVSAIVPRGTSTVPDATNGTAAPRQAR
jgi:chemotaxis protein MotB